MTTAEDPRRRWLALYVLCLGVLMIVLDTTVVTVALPSIQTDLGFTDTSLVWVLNAYMLTYGGFLLLGGRLGDLYGNRRWFLMGLVLFTVASLACGIPGTQFTLVAARALQGVGGAVVTAVALAIILNLFADNGERAKAMGIYGFVTAAGGTIGEVLGGVITQYVNWHWIFLINLPIGIAVYVMCLRLLPVDTKTRTTQKLDVTGAVTVTLGLMLAVYAIVNGNAAGWHSVQTLGMLTASAVLLGAFLIIESRVEHPLMPLRLFKLHNLAVANVIAVLWAAGMFAWFVMSALYLQRILNYSPLEVGLSFLPADLIMAIFSLGLSAKLVMRYGISAPLWVGLAIAALGLLLFARTPLDGVFWLDVLPGMVLMGLGGGMAFNPLLLAAMNDAVEDEAGLASGIVNTSFMMGGALGLAVLASLADGRTQQLLHSGDDATAALNSGYQMAFLIGALFTFVGAALGATLIRSTTSSTNTPPAH
ncbi:DHA2 family efflux MFS transporter permease subunit [Stenotrophobium rhamnosiphilum]|uniref:MFS transporter n=1 Tax=Stenotrophobium rhamnosiphilum TaxID=2029166 RepID=A0A2T5MC92_9GAMM|nr:DHA2 family efflux MFS transporter permease subunit [Stenotrophobium rhamnosiphilum]PTU30198.1 MFS transporter [Stenotrophobium rhamnosiphilum]